jgi:hypothetical protein
MAPAMRRSSAPTFLIMKARVHNRDTTKRKARLVKTMLTTTAGTALSGMIMLGKTDGFSCLLTRKLLLCPRAAFVALMKGDRPAPLPGRISGFMFGPTSRRLPGKRRYWGRRSEGRERGRRRSAKGVNDDDVEGLDVCGRVWPRSRREVIVVDL